jgi:hypothetical protein
MIILQKNQHQNKNITGLKNQDGTRYNYSDFRAWNSEIL